MYLVNASFIMEAPTAGVFLDRLPHLLKELRLMPSVSVMLEAGGVAATDAEAMTIAMQWRFESRREASLWLEDGFAGLASKTGGEFGERVMIFTSLFEEIWS